MSAAYLVAKGIKSADDKSIELSPQWFVEPLKAAET
jgi:hypothetical protein